MKNYIEANFDRFIHELSEWLSIPSVSTDPIYAGDMELMANKVKDDLESAGMTEARLFTTPGPPIVFAEKIIDSSLPTVLVYGHYDVQPPDPIEKWDSDPFELTIKKSKIHPEGAIYSRGASDDKGQVFMHLKALEYMIGENTLPCNVKVLIEGEEEIGSSYVETFVKEHIEMLECDVVLISDTEMLGKKIPSICVGLRGVGHVDISITAANRDLHSGGFGGAVPNPAHVLSDMISTLHDDDGRVTVDGFYDQVDEVSTSERDLLNYDAFSEEKFKKQIGLLGITGEKGYTTLERTSIRPTIDINGMWSGYTGAGSKTIVPATAHAKISFRLVPSQKIEVVTEKLMTYLKKITPSHVKLDAKAVSTGGNPYLLSLDRMEYKAASQAIESVYGTTPIPFRGGGSIPVVETFERLMQKKTVLLGFGLRTDNHHSPNEHFGIDNFKNGIETIEQFYHHFVKMYQNDA